MAAKEPGCLPLWPPWTSADPLLPLQEGQTYLPPLPCLGLGSRTCVSSQPFTDDACSPVGPSGTHPPWPWGVGLELWGGLELATLTGSTWKPGAIRKDS